MSAEDVTRLVTLMNERKPANSVLTPEVVMKVLKTKLGEAKMEQLGGDAAVLPRVKQLLASFEQRPAPLSAAPPAAKPVTAAAVAAKPTKRAESSSGDDDEDEESDSDFDDEVEVSDDDDSDSDSGDDDSSGSGSGSDSSSSSSSASGAASSSSSSTSAPDTRRRKRSEDATAAKPAVPPSDAAAVPVVADAAASTDAAPVDPEAQAKAMVHAARKADLVVRERLADESWEQYRDAYLVPFFAERGVAAADVGSKAALKRLRACAEIEALRKEADVGLDRTQRRGRPIFDASGKLIGIVGGAPTGAASKTMSALCDNDD